MGHRSLRKSAPAKPSRGLDEQSAGIGTALQPRRPRRNGNDAGDNRPFLSTV